MFNRPTDVLSLVESAIADKVPGGLPHEVRTEIVHVVDSFGETCREEGYDAGYDDGYTDAERDLESEYSNGYDAGHSDGFAEGYDEGLAQAEYV